MQRLLYTAFLLHAAGGARVVRRGLATQVSSGAAHPLARAEGVSLAWLNNITTDLWPHIRKAVRKMMKEEIVPNINKEIRAKATNRVLQYLMGQMELVAKNFDLGSQSPQLGPMKVYDLADQGMKIHLGLDFPSDAHIAFDYTHKGSSSVLVSAGIKKLHVSGEVIVQLAPLLDNKPVVGAARAYFRDPPTLDVDFTGVLDVLDMAKIKNLWQHLLRSVLSDLMVLPNVLGIVPVQSDEVVLARAMSAQPIGVLEVQALKAKDLNCNNFYGWESCDHFLEVELSGVTWASEVTQHRDSSPDWSQDSLVHNFLVYDREQRMQISVFDQDMVWDDTMGRVQLQVLEALGKHNKPMPLAGEGAKGTLTMGFRFLALSEPVLDLASCSGMVVVFIEVGKVAIPQGTFGSVNKVALRASLGDVVATTAEGTAWDGGLDAAEKVSDTLHDIINRMREKGVPDDQIKHYLSVDPNTASSALLVPQATGQHKVFDVHRTLNLVHGCDDAEIKLELLDQSKEVLVETRRRAFSGTTGPVQLVLDIPGSGVAVELAMHVRGLKEA